MDEKAQMLQYVGAGRPWYRRDMPAGVQVTYVLNSTGRTNWHAYWQLQINQRSGHRFEASLHDEFADRDEALKRLAD